MTAYRVALLGHGIGPSLSPALHVTEATRLGLEYEYTPIELIDEPSADIGGWLGRLEEQGFAATNVTHPFKQEVMAHVDRSSPAVEAVGSANLVLFGPEGRVAHNTDCTGFRAGLEAFLGEATGGRVLQVGGGGAGLATAYSLVGMGFDEVVVHDLSEAAAKGVVDRFSLRREDVSVTTSGGDVDRWLPHVDGVVHVTPTGMAHHPGVAFAPELLGPSTWLAEVVYRPLETELVRRARAHGLAVLDGGAMAVGQAADSLRLITGLEPDRDRMTAEFHHLIEAGG